MKKILDKLYDKLWEYTDCPEIVITMFGLGTLLTGYIAYEIIIGNKEIKENVQERIAQYQEIDAVPRSVVFDHSGVYGSPSGLEIVLSTDDDATVLANIYNGDDTQLIDYDVAAALIEAEINDEDSESIKLVGYYDTKGIFQVVSMQLGDQVMEYRLQEYIPEN